MRILGIAMTVFGLVWAIYALNMDVNVSTEAKTYSAGEISINVPSVEVVNVGLMDKRRNHLIFSGFVFLAGVLLLALGKDSEAKKNRACPYCAESINEAAVICRFCQKEVAGIKKDEEVIAPAVAGPKQSNGPSTFVHCKKCTALNEGDAMMCFRCQEPLSDS